MALQPKVNLQSCVVTLIEHSIGEGVKVHIWCNINKQVIYRRQHVPLRSKVNALHWVWYCTRYLNYNEKMRQRHTHTSKDTMK